MSLKVEDNTEKATVQKIAQAAGVSIASVSRALNNRPGIGEETRKRILGISQDLGYSAYPAIATLMSGKAKTNSIAFSIGPYDVSASRYLGVLWPELSASIQEAGYSLRSTHVSEKDLEPVTGIILTGLVANDPRIEICREMDKPYVCIGMNEGSFWVAPDDFNGGREATEHLIERGLTKICFVTPTTHGDGYQFRYQGYMSAMASNVLPIRELRTGNEPLGEIAAYRYFINLDKRQLENYQGFVCECDETALGVYTALRDRGYRIPEDFSVVGYDGLPGISEQLTTIAQDISKIAEHAVTMLVQAIKKEEPVGLVVPVTIKQGQTTVRISQNTPTELPTCA